MSVTQDSKTIAWIRQRMLAVAQRYIGHTPEAEDVVQDGMLKLLRHEPPITQESLAHAVTTVRSLAIDHLRTRHTTLTINEQCDSCSDRSAEDELIDDERRRRVNELIEALPPTQQMVMRMYHCDALTTHEIATLTGMAEGTVRQNISRARQRMAAQYRQQEI